MFKVKLVAFDLSLYHEWQSAFAGISDVDVIDGDILAQSGDAIVSPANSFGYMDGGLDLKFSQHFGWELERRLRQKLEAEFFGELPVGNAVIIKTDNRQIPYLISAPTMRVPSDVSATVNSYLAFKAILQTVLEYNNHNDKKIKSVLCPGLGTGEGRMPAQRCARQMLRAYEVVMLGRYETQGGLAGAVNDHLYLLG